MADLQKMLKRHGRKSDNQYMPGTKVRFGKKGQMKTKANGKYPVGTKIRF